MSALPARFVPALALSAAALMLAGCSLIPGTSTVTPSRAAAPASTASSSPAAAAPSPSPTSLLPDDGVTMTPAGSTWTVSAIAIGPLALGRPISVLAQELPSTVTNDLRGCMLATFPVTGGLQILATLSNDGTTSPAYADASVQQMILSANQATPSPASALRTSSPTTADGIGLGSTTAEVEAAYPAAQASPGPAQAQTHYDIPDGDGHHLVITLDSGVVSALQVGAASGPDVQICH